MAETLMETDTGFRIRLADEGDIKRIAEMEKFCFSDPWSEESVRKEIMENPRAFYVVGERDGMVQGYVGVWCIIDEGDITNVAVAPEFRRKHLAENLIKTLMDITEKEGINRWTLEVRVSNTPAIKLYEKMGFTSAGIRKAYYQDNHEDALIMWAEH